MEQEPQALPGVTLVMDANVVFRVMLSDILPTVPDHHLLWYNIPSLLFSTTK